MINKKKAMIRQQNHISWWNINQDIRRHNIKPFNTKVAILDFLLYFFLQAIQLGMRLIYGQ